MNIRGRSQKPRIDTPFEAVYRSLSTGNHCLWQFKRSTVMDSTPAASFTFKVQQQYFDFIQAGVKTVEGRCATGGYLTIKKGDIVNFQVDSDNAGEDSPSLTCGITRVEHYKTFSDMLQKEGIENCLPGTTDLQTGIDTYQSFPSYKEKEREFGVLAFEIKLCK